MESDIVVKQIPISNLLISIAILLCATSSFAEPPIPAQYPTWSPDERAIAFQRPGVPGEIWIVSSVGKNPRRLVTMPGSLAPIMRWAPDSSSLVIEVEPIPGHDRELRIVKVPSGHVRTIVTNGFAPRWSPNGSLIAFLRRDTVSGHTELWTVGLTSSTVSRVATSIAEHDFLWKHDGGGLIYLARGALHLITTDGLSTRTLTRVDNPMVLGRMANIDLSRDGRLAFVREGRLRTLDLASGQVVEVGAVRRPRGIAFSPDGKYLAFFERFPDGLIAVVPSVGGETRTVARTACLACRIRFDWAPDGRRIVTINTSVDRRDLYIVRANGGTSRLVAKDVSRGQGLRSFSPDERFIVYSNGALGPANNVHVADIRTRRSRAVTRDTVTSKLYPQWSPDGKWIAYFAGRAPDPQSTLELWLVAAEGGEPKLMTEGMAAISGDGFDWSAGSDSLLVASGNDNELWSVSVPTGDRRRLTTTGGWSDPWKGLPRWRPGPHAFHATYLGGMPSRIYGVSLDDVLPRNLTTRVDYSYAWDPRGESLAYAAPRGLYVSSAPDWSSQQITSDGGEDPSWAPSGSVIAYVGRDREVWKVYSDGGGPRRLTVGARALNVTFSPGGKWIAYDRVVSDPHLRIVNVTLP